MKNKMILSTSPFILSSYSTRRIMLDVIIALVPAMVVAAVYFGAIVLAMLAVCALAAVLTELCFNLIMAAVKGKKIDKKMLKNGSHTDLSAVVTGVLLALNLPAYFPLYWGAVGAVFAILFVKMLFGGVGRNFANPALAARVFLFIAFGSLMAKYSANNFATDGAATATWLGQRSETDINLLDMFLGLTPTGAVGEVCAVALLLGGAYLVVRKVIDFKMPLYIIIGTFIFALLIDGLPQVSSAGALNALVKIPTAHVLSGGLLLGAIFMATDYATSPNTELGNLIYGVAIALLVVLIRKYSQWPEGVSFAILVMNIVTPQIDKLIINKTFSEKKGKVSNE